MISQTAEYALRAMVYLADQERVPHTTAQIAQATQIPAGYLAKVMQALGRVRVVKSQRGLNGGFTLNREPGKLSLLEIINAVDPVRRFDECPLGLPTHTTGLCPLHRKLDETALMLEREFGATTVGDLVSASEEHKPLCRFPKASKKN
jgi:Rrf2 family protein